ncbi:MAG: hypothetical protein DWQ08_09835 [Proteobacteria bacterium]|nr:MAG: hypothetical protein DWQ08_09835 [Pseudomonadota bacterium]
MNITRWLLFAAVTALSSTPGFASDYDRFVGEFTGMFIPVDAEKGEVRDLGVTIREINNGINISWVTTTFDDDAQKTKKYSIDFLETERENILKAAQRKNLFGGRDPLDPMKGEPFAWARINNETLSVYVMLITDDGGYELQTYDRTLTQNGDLVTQYSRIRNGALIRALKATLNRQSTEKPEKNK